MPRIQARWKQKSCVLRAPKSRELIVVEFIGTYKVRAPTRKERLAAGIDFDDTPSESSSTLYARTREEPPPPPDDEGQERGDGA